MKELYLLYLSHDIYVFRVLLNNKLCIVSILYKMYLKLIYRSQTKLLWDMLFCQPYEGLILR